jgi:hypothetical protein
LLLALLAPISLHARHARLDGLGVTIRGSRQGDGTGDAGSHGAGGQHKGLVRSGSGHLLQLAAAGDGVISRLGRTRLALLRAGRRRSNHLTGLRLLLLLWRLLLRHPSEDDLLALLARGPGNCGEVGGLQHQLALLVGVGELGVGGVLLTRKGRLLDDKLGLERHLLAGHGGLLLLLLLLVLLVLTCRQNNICTALARGQNFKTKIKNILYP